MIGDPQNSDALRHYLTNRRGLLILPLGGCGEFGMNMTVFIHGNRSYVVDCGVMFPDPTKLGVDGLMPDVRELFSTISPPFAYIMTHGHEDHIGALPFMLRRYPAPVYASEWTCELITARAARIGISDQLKLRTVSHGDRIEDEGFSAEFFQVNHSIPMAYALMIRTSEGNVFHTGDFRLDAHPFGEAPASISRLRQIGDEGVDLLLCDSTNASKPGQSPSETTVIEPLTKEVRSTSGAAVITTFSSNLWRLRIICEIAKTTSRKIYVCGNSIDATLNLGIKLGLLEPPAFLETAHLNDVAREEILVLATGCQSEIRSGLARIANGEHKDFGLSPGDKVIYSSRIIPGNERYILATIDKIKRLGAEVVTTYENPKIHVSGHGYRGDIQLLLDCLQPHHFVPIHGSFTHLEANRANGEEANIKTVRVENGDALQLIQGRVSTPWCTPIPVEYIDGESRHPIEYSALRQRHKIGEKGLVIASGAFAASSQTWLAPVRLDIIGVALPENLDIDRWFQDVCAKFSARFQDLYSENQEQDKILEELRIYLRRRFADVLNKRPIVISTIQIV